jgi:hypothetical protein
MCSDLETRVQDAQLRENISCLFCFCPQRLGIQGFYKQGCSLCYISLIYVPGPIVVLNPISQGTN